MARILVIDDEECIRFSFGHFLREAGHEVVSASTYDEALAWLSGWELDLIFSDIILEWNTGIDVLQECRRRNLGCPVVMITGYPNVETAADAIRLGAFDYIPKPVEKETLLNVTGVALEHKRVTDERERHRSHLETIFRSVEDAIITVNNEMIVTEINAAAANIGGFPRDAVGKAMRSLEFGYKDKCLEALKETIEKRKSVKVCNVECGLRENSRTMVNLSTYPLIDCRDMFSGAVLVVREAARPVHPGKGVGHRQHLHNIVGKSWQMQRVYSLIEALAGVESTVLITGESGTGKELVAEALHHLGARRDWPLVKVNCSALSESLLESELFGHVKGAFTGAVSERVGRFQRANGGTIFLDEIGDLSRKVQSSLLRVLQKKEFERVGDSMPIRTDVRVIAATNKDLQEGMRLGEFRQDLLYRLKVVEVSLPPLRDRREDIPLLVEHFLREFNRKMKKKVVAISSDVEEMFLRYAWPGNIRELEHALEHAFVLCDQDTITSSYLPLQLRSAIHTGVSFSGGKHVVEPQAIVEALQKTAGNKKRAARLLGIDRKTLYRHIAKGNVALPT